MPSRLCSDTRKSFTSDTNTARNGGEERRKKSMRERERELEQQISLGLITLLAHVYVGEQQQKA